MSKASVTVAVPSGVDESTALRAAQRAVAEVAAIGLVEKVLADSPARIGPGHLAQVALREQHWRDVEAEWGLLSADEVTALTGGNTRAARDHTSNLRRRKGMAGVKRHGALHYPGFQFMQIAEDRVTVAPAWTLLRELLAPAEWSDADMLTWVSSPNGWLEGRSPAQEIHEHPEDVNDAVRNAVERAIPERIKSQAVGPSGIPSVASRSSSNREPGRVTSRRR